MSLCEEIRTFFSENHSCENSRFKTMPGKNNETKVKDLAMLTISPFYLKCLIARKNSLCCTSLHEHIFLLQCKCTLRKQQRKIRIEQNFELYETLLTTLAIAVALY